MQRALLVLLLAATAVLGLTPANVARAAAPSGYSVSRTVMGSRTSGIAVDPATNLVYVGQLVSVSGPGAVAVLDGASRTLEGSITVPSGPFGLAVNPSTDTIYVAMFSGLAVIDGSTSTVTKTIPLLSDQGRQVAVDAATNTAYATTNLANGASGIAVIDGTTDTIAATIALTSTTSIVSVAADPVSDTVYAGTRNGTIFAVDGATNTVIKSVQLSRHSPVTGLTFDSAAGSIYAVDGNVYAVDTVTLATRASITDCPSFSEGHLLAAAADPTANVVFVTSYGSSWPNLADSTCVIDTATNTVSESFPRGGTAVTADPATGAAYIAAWNPLNNVWTATPSSTDEVSPLVYGFPLGVPFATFAVGVQSSNSLLVSALPSATVTETGALPTGVVMSPSGVFAGTPAAGTAGTYPVTVTASNGVNPDSTVPLSIVVNIAPAITSPTSATFRTGVPGTFTVEATGTPPPTVSAVDTPAWIAVTPEASSAVLSGTPPPRSGGIYLVDLSAQNGSPVTASQTLTLTVNQPPSLTAASHLTFRAGRHVRYVITTSGFPTPAIREHGPLPRGLAFRISSGGTALIVGTPAHGDKGKHYIITITASNDIGHAATKTMTIRIR